MTPARFLPSARVLTAARPRIRNRAWRGSNLWRRIRDDCGSATGWAIGLVLLMLALTFLIVDGGRAMTAKVTALDVAQQAARAGAAQLDVAALRAGSTLLDPAAAIAAAQAFLTSLAATGTATATTAQVTVTVTRTQPTVLLNQLGITTITLTATATAQPGTA